MIIACITSEARVFIAGYRRPSVTAVQPAAIFDVRDIHSDKSGVVQGKSVRPIARISDTVRHVADSTMLILPPCGRPNL